MLTIGSKPREDRRNNILYVCPDTALLSAGIRRLYRHVDQLNRYGFNAAILHFKSGFHRNDLPEVPVHFMDRHTFGPDDIIVIPEGCPTIMKALKCMPGRRFAIALNWDYVFKDLPPATDWRCFNIERVLTVSPQIGKMISWSMGLPVHVLSSSIDQRHYYVDAKAKKAVVVYIKRKASHVDTLKRLLCARNPDYVEKIEWHALQGLSETAYSARIREAAIFLNLSEAEGYPTSCAEAMASGTLVAGYDSVGGRQLLIDRGPHQNCLTVPAGDYVSLAYALEPVLKALINGQWKNLRPVLANAQASIQSLTIENETKALISFWRGLCSDQNPSFTDKKLKTA